MATEVKVPRVGESVQEGMIQRWNKANGDWVAVDELLLELETDKATVEVMAESAGTLAIFKDVGTVVKVGETIATIDATKGAPGKTVAAASPTAPKAASTGSSAPGVAPQPPAGPTPGPAARTLMAEQNIAAGSIASTGPGGRPTKADVLNALNKKDSTPAPAAKAKAAPAPAPVFKGGSREQSREPMSMLRRRIAERLLTAQSQAAILTTFNEVDMTAINEMREKHKDAFFEKHGVKLGFMGFFVKAAVSALEAFPRVNSYIEGTDIVSHSYCDIGVAVSTDKGLIVPIIRNAEMLSLADVEKTIAAYAQKARENKIALDDITGGTFTVSNGGIFGSLLSTPILNPPQSAILGMHKTQLRPVVTAKGTIEARPMMYLALSYDHRIIDGKEAVGFLIAIKNAIEDPSRLFLRI